MYTVGQSSALVISMAFFCLSNKNELRKGALADLTILIDWWPKW